MLPVKLSRGEVFIMATERLDLFNFGEIEVLSELRTIVDCHQSIRNLLRRSLIVDGELRKPHILKQILLGKPVLVTNEAGGYNKSDNKGFMTYPVGEFNLQELPEELRKALINTFGEEIPNLEIYATHETYSTLPAVSIVSLYDPSTLKEEVRTADDTGIDEDDELTGLRVVCNAGFMEADRQIKGKKTISSGFELGVQLIQFANDRLDAYLKGLRSKQAS